MDIINTQEISELGLSKRQANRFSKIALNVMAYHADWEGWGAFMPFVAENAEKELERLKVPRRVWGITDLDKLLSACVEQGVI